MSTTTTKCALALACAALLVQTLTCCPIGLPGQAQTPDQARQQLAQLLSTWPGLLNGQPMNGMLPFQQNGFGRMPNQFGGLQPNGFQQNGLQPNGQFPQNGQMNGQFPQGFGQGFSQQGLGQQQPFGGMQQGFGQGGFPQGQGFG